MGAAVLVALGVIFIPMLLERGAEDSRLSVKMQIPPQPNTQFKDRTRQDQPSGQIEPLEPLEPIEESVASVDALQENPGAQTAEDGAKSSDAATQTASKQPQAAPSKPEPKPEPDKPAESAEGEWIVQVGSFSRRSNAEVLRDKLKSSGFNAFMETAKADTGPVYRVRVGPQKKRADAESMVKRLSEKGGYRGIVMSYSP